MNEKWKRLRQSVNIEDRRKPRDINRPVVQGATDPPPDPTTVNMDRTRYDRFRAETAVKPLQLYDPLRRRRR